MVEDFVVVEQAAEGDDDVLADDARLELALENDLRYRRDLPPCNSGCPDTRGIRPHDRSSQAANATVHVRVAVRGNSQSPWPCVALFHHDLMSDARPCRVEICSMKLRETFDGAVFVQIQLVPVLDIVIERKDELSGIPDFLRPDGLELLHHGRSIVMRHHAVRPDGNEVPRPQRPVRPFSQMCLRKLFYNRLPHTSPALSVIGHSTLVILSGTLRFACEMQSAVEGPCAVSLRFVT